MKRARSSSDSPSSTSNILSGEQRINKLLAAAGLGSRRQVDELIEQGRVEIDGVICDQLGMKVDADVSKITVDGTALKKFKPVYYALNKPSGVLCTNRDPQGRRRAIDYIPGHQRLFPVGRLDASSVGLLLLTNDGELTQQLTHPKHGVPKTYYVVVAGQMEPDEIRRLRRGIYLSDGVARVDFVKIRNLRKSSTELEITLSEGKNREIRRVLARIGHKVVSLTRLSIGPLKMGNLPEAAYRPLSKDEVAALYRAAEDARKARKTRKKENVARTHEIEESKAARAAKKGIETPEEVPASIPSKRPSSRLTPRNELQEPSKKPSSKKPVKKSPAAERDPFAWDDDDELLSASPFAPHHQSSADDEADDDEDGWVNELDDDDDDDGFPASKTTTEDDMFLVDDRESMRTGGVLDYDDDGESKPKNSGRTRKKPEASDSRRGTKKTLSREPRSNDRPRGTKKSANSESRSFDQTRSGERTPRTGKKKFVTPKSAKKGGFKKGGFKKGGFKKGGFKKGGGIKKGGFNRGGRSSKGTPPKSSARNKRRP